MKKNLIAIATSFSVISRKIVIKRKAIVAMKN
jgi:hypothetical protein